MPCTYDNGPVTYSGVSQSEYDKLKDELDLVTRMLCEITSVAPSKYIDNVVGLRVWVDRHARMDEERRKREEKERERRRKELNKKKADIQKEIDALDE